MVRLGGGGVESVTEFSRDIKNVFFESRLEDFGMDAGFVTSWQFGPDVQAPPRFFPQDVTRKMRANGLDHDGGFLGVPLLEQSKMALINARLHRVGQKLLEQIGRAKIVVPLDAANRSADGLGQKSETHAGAGGK